MARWRNTGALHIRADGSEVKHGEVFEADEEEIKPFKDKFEKVSGETSRRRPRSAAGAEDEDELDEWKLRMSPARYLELHPDGPNAELAQQYVDAGQGDEGDDEDNE